MSAETSNTSRRNNSANPARTAASSRDETANSASAGNEDPNTAASATNTRRSGSNPSSRAANTACKPPGTANVPTSPTNRYTPSTGTTTSRSINERIVSTANNGIPCACALIARRAFAGIPGTNASTRSSIDRGSNGPTLNPVRFRPTPKPGRDCTNSGRANSTTKIGTPRAQSMR